MMINVDYPGLVTFLLLLLTVLLFANIVRKETGERLAGVLPSNADAIIRDSGEYIRTRIAQSQPIARKELGGTLTLNGERWRGVRPNGKGMVWLYVREDDILPSFGTAAARTVGVI